MAYRFAQAASGIIGGIHAVVGSGGRKPGTQVAIDRDIEAFDTGFVEVVVHVPGFYPVRFILVGNPNVVFLDDVFHVVDVPVDRDIQIFPGIFHVDVVVVCFFRFQVWVPDGDSPAGFVIVI